MTHASSDALPTAARTVPRPGARSASVAAAGHSPLARVFAPVLALLSSVPFGIVLLTILFFYCSIGSAGVIYPIHPNIFSADAWVHAQIRQFRPFEMTEFEWFHWWPFNLLILLLCLNIAITTVRRIRFGVINLGVWMIHTGIIVLAIGSVIYFSRKVEGDAPVARRTIVASVDTPEGAKHVSLVAAPGNRATLAAGEGRWTFEVASIDPAWEIRSGDDAGKRAYSVNVMVDGPGGRFMRQLLAGYPAYTEDVLFTGDPDQPMQRAVKATGKALVDESLRINLEYAPQRWFYLKNDAVKSWALYVRRPGDSQWIERPIHGLPLYNDFIASREDVLVSPGDDPPPIDPIDIEIPPVDSEDPFPDVTFHATGYLRYAMNRTALVGEPEGAGLAPGPFAPGVQFQLGMDGGRNKEYMMLARDPQANRSEEGLIRFKAVPSEEAMAALLKPPTLEIEVPAAGFSVSLPVTALSIVDPTLAFTPAGESGYSWRVRTIEDEVPLGSGAASVAIVELRTPKGEFRRWVFDDPSLTRDVADESARDAHGPAQLIDDGIAIRYRPGTGRAVLTLVAGPSPEELRAVVSRSSEPVEVKPLRVGTATELGGGLSIRTLVYEPRARVQTRPAIVPREQRMRDAGEFFSQVKLEVPGQQVSFPRGVPWIPFHRYPFASEQEALRRFPYQPTTVALGDGRQVEVLFSRQRHALPAPVVLDDFVLSTHLGGFTGETTSIRNYTSVVRFGEPSAEGREGWGPPTEVSVNEPIERDGWWFFQAQWDPPDEARGAGGRAASAGLNYTVLGVGNREGVWIQLAGCVIAVAGMIYAFYIKPILKRRRAMAVQAQAAAGAPAPRPQPALVAASNREFSS